MPRTPEKFGQVLAVMRRRIVRGRLRPGERLPVRADLEQEFAASSGTVQRVFDALARDGFVEARGQFGTFVAPRPPHLCQYALVFCGRPDDPYSGTWSRAYQVLVEQAASISRAGDRHRRVRSYYGVDGHADSEDFRALLGDVRAARLAGLVFVHGMHMIESTPLVQGHGVPMVSISSSVGSARIPCVVYDNESFVDAAVNYLLRARRRRVAVLAAAASGGGARDARLLRALENHGINSPPQWWQYAYPHDPRAARNAVHLLAHVRQHERPDALLITDDHLLAPALAGLADAGAMVGGAGGIEIVSHWNFPLPLRTDNGKPAPPVTLVGFDGRVALERAIELLDARRAHRIVPEHVLIPADVRRAGEVSLTESVS